MNNEDIVIVDLEATCQTDNYGFQMEIIEIGAVKTDGSKFSAFVRPIINTELSDFCKELTTIEQSDVDSAQLFTEVYPEFRKFIEGCEVYSWGEYDRNQFARDLRLHNIEDDYISEHHHNLKHLYTERTGKLAGYFPKAMKAIGLNFVGTSHRGIDDAENMMTVYKKIMEIE